MKKNEKRMKKNEKRMKKNKKSFKKKIYCIIIKDYGNI